MRTLEKNNIDCICRFQHVFFYRQGGGTTPPPHQMVLNVKRGPVYAFTLLGRRGENYFHLPEEGKNNDERVKAFDYMSSCKGSV